MLLSKNASLNTISTDSCTINKCFILYAEITVQSVGKTVKIKAPY